MHDTVHRSLWKGPALTSALLLLLPIAGNHFVADWHWEFRAFVLFGTLIFLLGLAFQVVTRNAANSAHRAAIGMTLFAAFGLFWGNWVQGADDINPHANIYFLVLFILIAGLVAAAAVRFRTEVLQRVLLVTAIAQVLAITAQLMLRNPEITPWSEALLRGYAGNIMFAALFGGAATLLRSRDTALTSDHSSTPSPDSPR